MYKTDYRYVTRNVGSHGKIMAKGFVRVLSGAFIAGLIGLSVFCFRLIPTVDGYLAVLDFAAAAAALGAALAGMYAIGGGKKRKGGFEK